MPDPVSAKDSEKIDLSNPYSEFGKLSPLYDNLDPPIVDKRVLIDKIGDVSTSLICYVYAGLVKDRSLHRSLIEENPKDVEQKGLFFYQQEQDQFLIDALDHALTTKFKSLKSQRELLSSGDRFLVYRTNVTAFNHSDPNLIGNKLMMIRTMVRRQAAEYIIKNEIESEKRKLSRIYKVYQVLKDKFLDGQDLTPYFFKTYNEIFDLLRLNDDIVITNIKSLSMDLQNVANNIGHAAILPHLVMVRNNNNLRHQHYVENLVKVRDAYFSTIIADKNERQRYMDNIPNLENLTARIFFLWKRGIIKIPVEAEATLEPEFMAVDRESYEDIAKMYHRDMLKHLGYNPIICNDPVSSYQIVKMEMSKKEKQDNSHLSRFEIEYNQKGEDIIIHENDVNNPGSLLHHEPIEIDNRRFPTILHYIAFSGLTHLGMTNVEAYQSIFQDNEKKTEKEIGQLFKEYYDRFIDHRNEIIQKRMEEAINQMYSISHSDKGDKLPRVLVYTGTKKLVYYSQGAAKVNSKMECQGCHTQLTEKHCNVCDRVIAQNFFSKKFINKLIEQRNILIQNKVEPIDFIEHNYESTRQMKDIFKKDSHYILSRIEEMTSSLKLLADYKLSKVTEKDNDNIISLYSSAYERFVVGKNPIVILVRTMLSKYAESSKRNPTYDFIGFVRKSFPSIKRDLIQKLWDEAITLKIVLRALKIDTDTSQNTIFSESDLESEENKPSILLYSTDKIYVRSDSSDSNDNDNGKRNKMRNASKNLVERTKRMIRLREAQEKGDVKQVEEIKKELREMIDVNQHIESQLIPQYLLKNYIANALMNILHIVNTNKREWVVDDLWFAFSLLTTRKYFEDILLKGMKEIGTEVDSIKNERINMIQKYVRVMKGKFIIQQQHIDTFSSLLDYIIEELASQEGILSRAIYFSTIRKSEESKESDESKESEESYTEEIGSYNENELRDLASKVSKFKNDDEEEDDKEEKDEEEGEEGEDKEHPYEEEDGGEYEEEYGRFDDDEVDENDD